MSSPPLPDVGRFMVEGLPAAGGHITSSGDPEDDEILMAALVLRPSGTPVVWSSHTCMAFGSSSMQLELYLPRHDFPPHLIC
jgi:hypothetical protein